MSFPCYTFRIVLDMTKPLNPNNSAITKSIAEKVLATVTYDNGFHFFTSIGEYTGETAVSLETFAKKVEHAPIESIDFSSKERIFKGGYQILLAILNWQKQSVV